MTMTMTPTPSATPTPNALVERLAGKFYTIYSEKVGGKAFNGDPLPDWEEFGSDQGKTLQADAWRGVAANVAEVVNMLEKAGQIKVQEKPEWLQRLIDEQAELEERLEKLRAWIKEDGFMKLNDSNRALLNRQSSTMAQLNEILTERIEILTGHTEIA